MHSIIIPNRGYTRYLRWALWSIKRSAEVCGERGYEVVVVDDGSDQPPISDGHVRFLRVPPADEYFNKPMLQNIGIEDAQGDIFSFLDADTIVAPQWIRSAERLRRLGPMALTKLCYRVRYLPKGSDKELDGSDDAAAMAGDWFRRYEEWPLAAECYGSPETRIEEIPTVGGVPVLAGKPVFGNSQFSILRTTLGELRFNERYQGRGYEDLWMNRAIWRQYRDEYLAGIVTDPDHALLQIRNEPQGELWGAGKQNTANERRYRRT